MLLGLGLDVELLVCGAESPAGVESAFGCERGDFGGGFGVPLLQPGEFAVFLKAPRGAGGGLSGGGALSDAHGGPCALLGDACDLGESLGGGSGFGGVEQGGGLLDLAELLGVPGGGDHLQVLFGGREVVPPVGHVGESGLLGALVAAVSVVDLQAAVGEALDEDRDPAAVDTEGLYEFVREVEVFARVLRVGCQALDPDDGAERDGDGLQLGGGGGRREGGAGAGLGHAVAAVVVGDDVEGVGDAVGAGVLDGGGVGFLAGDPVRAGQFGGGQRPPCKGGGGGQGLLLGVGGGCQGCGCESAWSWRWPPVGLGSGTAPVRGGAGPGRTDGYRIPRARSAARSASMTRSAVSR